MVNDYPKNGTGYVNGSSRSVKVNDGATLRITWKAEENCWLEELQIKDGSGTILASYDSEALSTMSQVTFTMPKKNIRVVFDFGRDGPTPCTITTKVNPSNAGAHVDVYGDGVSGDGPTYTCYEGDTVTFEMDVDDEWLDFDHFVVNGTRYDTNPLTYTVEDDTTVTLYVKQYVPPHAIIVSEEPSGGGDCYLTGDAYLEGDNYYCEDKGVVQVHAVPGEYYVFKYFLINGTKYTSNPCSYTVKKDTTIKAVFVYDLFDVNVSVTPADSGFVSVSKDAARSGETVSVSFSPAEGYMLDSWSVSGTGAKKINDYSFTMGTADATVKVKFKVKPTPTDHSITIRISPSGGGSVSAPSTARDDEIVPVSISPAPGYKLKSWTVSGGGATKISESAFRMGTANAKVTVTFEKAKYTVTTSYGTASPVSGTTGTKVTVKFYLPHNCGYIANVTDSDGSISYTAKTGRVDSSGGMTVTLTFKIRTSDVTVSIGITT